MNALDEANACLFFGVVIKTAAFCNSFDFD